MELNFAKKEIYETMENSIKQNIDVSEKKTDKHFNKLAKKEIEKENKFRKMLEEMIDNETMNLYKKIDKHKSEIDDMQVNIDEDRRQFTKMNNSNIRNIKTVDDKLMVLIRDKLSVEVMTTLEE